MSYLVSKTSFHSLLWNFVVGVTASESEGRNSTSMLFAVGIRDRNPAVLHGRTFFCDMIQDLDK